MDLRNSTIKVKFEKEQGYDLGGPRKEFLQTVAEDFKKSETPQFFSER